ncbi:MAG TPA: family 43 glycosylhydrolase [Acidimicrobiales bacterium]|nr:family 43 glycosylhydrolase [Acidimicrobiales bacterium]
MPGLVRVLGGIAVTLASTCFVALSFASPADAAPTISGDAADPDLVNDGGDWWMVTTNHGFGNVPRWRSSNPTGGWRWAGDALPRVPAWATPGFTWAPTLMPLADGTWALYVAAHHTASGRQCIAVALGASPGATFTPVDTGPIVCQLDRGGSIDPAAFVDDDGSRFLVWKSDDNAIGRPASLFAQRLSADGRRLEGPAARLLDHDRSWEVPLIENPEMVRDDGRLLLLYSAGWWESDGYVTGVAECSSPLGPCRKVTSQCAWSAPTAGLRGAGGASVEIDDTGRAWMAVHAWTGRPGYRFGTSRAAHVIPVELPGSDGVDAAALGRIDRLYLAVLGREPDQGGRREWTEHHRCGMPLDGVAGHLTRSPEFASRFGRPDDATFVDLLYRNVLGRPADPGGRRHWAGALASGVTRPDLITQFSESREFVSEYARRG